MASDLDRQFDEMLGRDHRARRSAGDRSRFRRPRHRHQFSGDSSSAAAHLQRALRRSRGAGRRGRAADFPGSRPLVGADLALALAARGIAKGDRVGIAMRNCPSWIVAYMAVVKAGAVATLINGWWQTHELEHAMRLIEPKLVIADGPRAKRIEGVCGACEILCLDVAQPLEVALAPIMASAPRARDTARGRRPRTMRRSCSRRARLAKPRGRCRPTARSRRPPTLTRAG